MKFSKQLSYNAVAEWRKWYLDYSGLKKFLKNFEFRKSLESFSGGNLEEHATPSVVLQEQQDSPLSSPRASFQDEEQFDGNIFKYSTDSLSLPDDAREGSSIRRSFSPTEEYSGENMEQQTKFLGSQGQERVSLGRTDRELLQIAVEDNMTAEDKFQELEGEFFRLLWEEANKVDSFYRFLRRRLDMVTSKLTNMQIVSSVQPKERGTLRQDLVEHFLEVVELQNFAALNRTGFEKILKKHDKLLGMNTKDTFLSRLEQYSFYNAQELNSLKERLEHIYCNLFCNDDLNQAKNELYGSVREMIVWERNTIWREMLQQERKLANITSRQYTGDVSTSAGAFIETKPWQLLLAVMILLLVLLMPIFSSTYAAAHRCLAMLIFVGVLWVTEAIPLYVTSLSIPFLSVLLRCFVDSHGKTLSSHETAIQVLASMASPVIMLILGGYSLAAALSKHTIDKWLATLVLSRFKEPRLFLLLVMLLGTTLSMFLSNVAVPVLLFSVLRPLLIGLPPSSLPFVKCVVLGVAFSGNIGGMTTPIASPQNAIAVEQLNNSHPIGFVEWTLLSLPLALLIVAIIHRLLILWYRPSLERLPILPTHSIHWNKEQLLTLFTLFLSIFLWGCKPVLNILGSEGIIAIVPIVIFFGSGVLGKEDFNSMPWNVIYLVAGGISLGTAVKSSQLLDIATNSLESIILRHSLWLVFSIFCIFTMLCSLLVSHTVSAIIILPILAQVGVHMGHVRLFVVGGAVACSCSMALPVSSFPNMCALHVENETGKRYVQSKDFLSTGTMSSIIAGACLCSIGFALFYLVGL
ncbi:hypothetical protein GpartN1_g5780.t1 [Galdieria partita]|uniref:SPX domain-containing protein n=1 Tax=Galdieria partita TaxID=83374 RepID=A0A9C7USB9_9RHOD|nr:hypothetical protein GpartN1_g5780.t1 [Galdieria partita]